MNVKAAMIQKKVTAEPCPSRFSEFSCCRPLRDASVSAAGRRLTQMGFPATKVCGIAKPHPAPFASLTSPLKGYILFPQLGGSAH